MKGEIEKIWKNQTADGRRYNVIQIGGERYSLWEGDYLDTLSEGQALEFDFRESGEYRNISKIYEPKSATEEAPITEGPEAIGKPPEYVATGSGGGGNGGNGGRSRQIVRMSCLRSASQILGGSRIPAGERAEKTIEIAKKFEKYIDDDPALDIAGLDDGKNDGK
jgi:hypothetical protein